MTNPELSKTTTKQIGRVYGLPGNTLPKNLSSAAVRKLLATGEVFPSITNVLNVLNKDLQGYAIYMMGKALREGQDIAAASKAPDMFRDHASARGSAVHNLIEEYINAGNGRRGMFLPAFKALAGWQEVQELGGEGYMKAFIRFANDYKPTFHQQESTVFGSTVIPDNVEPNRFNYAGTTDFIATIGGVKVVGDWKCTSKLHGSVSRQMAAVKYATHYWNPETNTLEEWPGDTIEQAIAVRLCADGTYEIKASNLEQGWASFQRLRAEWEDYAFGDGEMLRDLNPFELK